VRADDQVAAATNAHTFDAAAQTGDVVALEKVDLHSRPASERAGQFRTMVKEHPHICHHSLAA
jgi:hypothetical protein